jgi:ABC-type branched-subunit amino acid transport system substrate-binding protein
VKGLISALPVFRMAPKALKIFTSIILALALSACGGSFGTRSIFGDSEVAPQKPVVNSQNAARVALLVPLTGPGNIGNIGTALKEAGELAIFDAGGAEVVLIPIDTKGTQEGARLAAQQALQEGAEIILGPLLSANVRPVAQEVRAKNIPVLAFSSDRRVAGNGIFLLSFLPAQEIGRVVNYAVAQGSKGFASLIPQSPYGNLVNTVFDQAVSQNGGKVLSVEQYARNAKSAGKNISRLATFAKSKRSGVGAIFLPEGGPLLYEMAAMLEKKGITKDNVRLMGTGLWDEPGLSAVTALNGGWYASPDPASKSAFIARYKNAYNKSPLRIASLAYDGVSLAAVLAASPKGQRYTVEQLTNRDGFDGVDGLFRLLRDGTNERALAVLELRPGGAQVVSPAPRRFNAAPAAPSG